MAFVLTETIAQELVNEVNENNPGYQFDWRTYIWATEQDGRIATTLMLLENSEGFMAVHLGVMDVSTIKKVTFIARSEIQGVRMHKGLLNYILKIRMYNGEFYKFRINGRYRKKCPLHSENVLRYHEQFTQGFQDKKDLSDRSSGWLSKIGIALMIGLAVVAAIAAFAITKTRFVAYGAFVAVLFGGAFLAGLVETVRSQNKDKAFYKPYDHLTQQEAALSPEELYQALLQLPEKPQTQMYQAAYYGRLVQLAHQLGKDDEAKLFLDQYPRRYSEKTEETYHVLVNLLATPLTYAKANEYFEP